MMKMSRRSLFLLILLPVILCSQLQAEVQRVEPPNWWSGLSTAPVQVLIYGEAIGSLEARVEADGVRLDRVVRVENPNYLFLYLDLGEAGPGHFAIELLKDGELAASIPYELFAREPGSREREGFTASDVIYLITPDRFVNGDRSNDEVPAFHEPVDRTDGSGRHGGDIKGIIDSLDYIEAMGFTAIWLNPVLENFMTRAYHGYATTDFYDMILNHSGSSHWFVKDPPARDWINFGGEFVPTSHRRQTNQDIYASEFDKRLHADGWFVEAMPDLNQRHPLMADYLIQNTLWWIEYAGLQGIRMDTWPYPDKDYMARWTRAVMDAYPAFNIVGEEWSLDVPIVAYWQKGKVNHDGYVCDVPSMMDFPLQNALKESLTDQPREYHEPFLHMYEKLALDYLYPDPGNLVIFPDNHDMARFYTQVNEDLELFKMGMVYFATMRGIPQIYYGTEILMDSSENPDDHGIIRTDFPGGWEGDAANAFTGEGLSDDQKDAQAFMKQLLNWRKGAGVVHTGHLMHFAPVDGIYVYFRYDEADTVMVVMNRNPDPVDLELDRYAERLEGREMAEDIMCGKRYNLVDGLTIPPRSAVVFEVE
jgi:glycosidase